MKNAQLLTIIASLPNIKRHEGYRSKPYKCSEGVLTVGYGTNLDIGLDEDEAAFLLEYRLKKVSAELSKHLPWWEGMPLGLRLVLLDMGYQLGVSRLLRFRKALGALKAKRYIEGAAEMLDSNWAKQTPERANENARKVHRFGELIEELPWVAGLMPGPQHALLEMYAELGLAGLLSFKQMLSALHAGETTKAAEEMTNSAWARRPDSHAKSLWPYMAGLEV